MLTFDSTSKHGVYKLNLPTTLSDITKEYIESVTSNVKIDANYTLIGIVYRERLSTLILAASKNKKKSDISVIPIFVKAGETDSKLINSLKVCDKLIISPSDIMLGYHISTPNNLLTINNVIDLVVEDKDLYQKLIGVKEDCYFIEFKLVPNCNIHGAYVKDNVKEFVNPYITKIAEAKESNIIIPNKPNVIV